MTRTAAALVCHIALCLPAFAGAQDLPDGPGRETVVTLCRDCHDLETVVATRRTPQNWRLTIEGMASRGAGGSDDELAVVWRYLTTQFGRVNVNVAPATELEMVLALPAADAETIVRYRTEHGDFADLEGLKKVPGLTAARVDTWKDRIAFQGQ